MTRLNEALTRAGRNDGETAEATQPGDAAAAIPSSWRFDAQPDAEVPPSGAGSAHAAALPDLDVVSPAVMPEQQPSDPSADPPAPDDRTYEDAPRLKTSSMLVHGLHSDKALLEQYRHVAAALHHAQLRTGARTVMVASAVTAEGKTTTATNLALTLSQSHQRRVLLIDADLRRPSIHTILGLANHAGLTETLRDVSGKARVPIHQISPTLSVITAGRPTDDPMSVLVSEMMRRFLEEAADNYDWVIIDTPPIALLSDANLLAAMVDQAVLVVAATSTPYPLVRRAVDAIGAPKILGVVLNRAERSELSSGYGYGYAYRYAYAEPAKPKRRWLLPFRQRS